MRRLSKELLLHASTSESAENLRYLAKYDYASFWLYHRIAARAMGILVAFIVVWVSVNVLVRLGINGITWLLSALGWIRQV